LAVNGNNVFAGTDNYGVYLSTNNGTNWTQTSFNNQSVISLAVNRNNIFAGTYNNNGVYLSTNNGTGWAQTSLNFLRVQSLGVTGNNVFVGTSLNGVFVSNNNGGSWTARNEGLNNALNILTLCIFNNYIYAGTYGYGVYRRPLSELVGIEPISNEVPNSFSLSQNYPNPFNPTTNIKFSVPNRSFVKIIIYDALGRKVDEPVNSELNAGTFKVDCSGGNFSSGVYYYQLTSESYKETKRMVLIK